MLKTLSLLLLTAGFGLVGARLPVGAQETPENALTGDSPALSSPTLTTASRPVPEPFADNPFPVYVSYSGQAKDLLAPSLESPDAWEWTAQGETAPETTEPAPTEAAPESAASPSKSKQGWYIALSGSFQNREQATEANPESEGNTFFVFDPGLNVNGAVGYRFDNFRVDAEFSFFNNGVASASANGLRQLGFAPAAAQGSVNLYAYMFNVYYDIPIDNSQWKPYLGFGLGFYQSQINGATASFFNIPELGVDIPAVNATSSNLPFAYQIRAGVGYGVTENLDLYLGYRYFHGEQLEFTSPGLGTFNPNGASVHNVELGIRAIL